MNVSTLKIYSIVQHWKMAGFMLTISQNIELNAYGWYDLIIKNRQESRSITGVIHFM